MSTLKQPLFDSRTAIPAAYYEVAPIFLLQSGGGGSEPPEEEEEDDDEESGFTKDDVQRDYPGIKEHPEDDGLPRPGEDEPLDDTDLNGTRPLSEDEWDQIIRFIDWLIDNGYVEEADRLHDLLQSGFILVFPPGNEGEIFIVGNEDTTTKEDATTVIIVGGTLFDRPSDESGIPIWSMDFWVTLDDEDIPLGVWIILINELDKVGRVPDELWFDSEDEDILRAATRARNAEARFLQTFLELHGNDLSQSDRERVENKLDNVIIQYVFRKWEFNFKDGLVSSQPPFSWEELDLPWITGDRPWIDERDSGVPGGLHDFENDGLFDPSEGPTWTFGDFWSGGS